jgi:hypothetical protein
MEKDDGEPHSGAGQDCPAQEPFEAPTEITINGERLRIVQATDEEGKAITQCLKERAESAPAGARIGRASALARVGLRFAAVVLLAAGVGIGLGDGNVFDDVGCSVAQQPRRASHGADSGQAGEHRNGTDEDGGLTIEDGGGHPPSSDFGAARRPECEMRAEMCVNRMPDGLCRMSNRQCRLIQLPIADFRLPIEKIVGRTADILQAILFQRDLLTGLIRGQEKLLAMGPPVAVAKTPLANKELRTIGRFQYGAGFKDVWLGGEHYDLRGRARARFCIQYLVAKQAFDADSARHLDTEIDPFVRKKCQLPPPSEIRIQHYFNDRSGKLSRLRRDLVKAAGRNGRFYLQAV